MRHTPRGIPSNSACLAVTILGPDVTLLRRKDMRYFLAVAENKTDEDTRIVSGLISHCQKPVIAFIFRFFGHQQEDSSTSMGSFGAQIKGLASGESLGSAF